MVRRAVLPSLPWVVCFLSFFLYTIHSLGLCVFFLSFFTPAAANGEPAGRGLHARQQEGSRQGQGAGNVLTSRLQLERAVQGSGNQHVCWLFVRGLGGAGQGGGERRAASARSATKRGDGDVHGGSVHGAAPVAAPRSGGGALSEAGCPAQPAGNAPDGGAKKIEREFTVG